MVRTLRVGWKLPTIMLLSLVVAGCGTLPNGRGWGQDAIWPVDLDRVTRAAHDAFFNPGTLIPLAGAGIFYIEDFDERVVHWATKHRPIYGTADNAIDAGEFKSWLEQETYVTGFLTPSSDDPEIWAYSKAKGLGVNMAAREVTLATATFLKKETDRTRPDGSNDKSSPSSSASVAFSSATLANGNLDYVDFESMGLPGELRRILQFGNLGLATGVAWARVELGAHYPSDVLAGAALGHFISAFFQDAFLGLPQDDRFSFLVAPYEGGAIAQLSFSF